MTIPQALAIEHLKEMLIPYYGCHPKRPRDYDLIKASENTIWLYDQVKNCLDEYEVWSIDISPMKNTFPSDLLKLIPVLISMISSIAIPKECRKGKRLQSYFALENGDKVVTSDHLHGIVLAKPAVNFIAKQPEIISKLKSLTLVPNNSRSVRVCKVVSPENLGNFSEFERLLRQFHYMSKQTNEYRDPLAQHKQ